MFEPASYRICIQGTLEKRLSDYYGGMTIEHASDPKRGAMSILTGLLPDQTALMGILNSIYDFGYPLLSVEYRAFE
jgi:hypothetical protein